MSIGGSRYIVKAGGINGKEILMDQGTAACAKKQTVWERLSIWTCQGMRFSDGNKDEKNLEVDWREQRS